VPEPFRSLLPAGIIYWFFNPGPAICTRTGAYNIMSDMDNLKTSMTGRQSLLSQIEDIQKTQNMLKSAMGGDLRAEYRKQQSVIPENILPGFVVSAPKNTDKSLSSVGDLGKIVRQKRKTMSLSQQQLADITGVGRRFISELESGKPTLEFGRVLRVCQSIGIDLTAVAR